MKFPMKRLLWTLALGLTASVAAAQQQQQPAELPSAPSATLEKQKPQAPPPQQQPAQTPTPPATSTPAQPSTSPAQTQTPKPQQDNAQSNASTDTANASAEDIPTIRKNVEEVNVVFTVT